MGLMFIFPVDEKEEDRVSIKDGKITLKTYGLPMIFWGYLLASLSIIVIMAVAIKNPLKHLMETGDPLNILLGQVVTATLLLIPLGLLAGYFYEKWITKSGERLTITHRIFWLPVYWRNFTLASSGPFNVQHFMDSPNVARQKNDSHLKGFQNKGYFELTFTDNRGKTHFLDRHARKADLKKMVILLQKY